MNIFVNTLLFCIVITLVKASTRRPYALNENWVCNVKRSCLDCLQLSQCSWCQINNKCFSRKLPNFEEYCQNNYTNYQNHGLSYYENAMCACAASRLEENCSPEGDTSGLKCSGRGECLCGRCVCDSKPDPDHPTKIVIGQYCEYDNFSCDEPRCNEGPYHYLGGANTDSDSLIVALEK
ncbi:hypothetical protein evm_013806 [Chilo suppressalis]|nr:hypothetical protein evm_013806 [Chilo suppressalis]